MDEIYVKAEMYEALEVIKDMVYQHCSISKKGMLYFDSYGIRSDEKAIRLLDQYGILKIEKQSYDRVIAILNDDE